MMTDAHVRFVKEKLIPEILKDGGKHFSMHNWTGYEGDCPICIGGKIEEMFPDDRAKPGNSYEIAGEHIGLDKKQSNRLFYDWYMLEEHPATMTMYPMSERLTSFLLPYCRKYHKFRFNQRKRAEVAVSLLKEVCRTRGECLND